MDKLRRLNLGCGTQRLPGWENYDMDMDIREPLPVEDASVQFIHAEHVIEHVTHHEAWRFLEECKRVLAPRGVIRLSFPSIVKVLHSMKTQDKKPYLAYNKKRGWSDGSVEGALRSTMFCHKHLALWTEELMVGVLSAIGFSKAYGCKVGVSTHSELRDIEGHGKVIGKYINDFQTAAVEGVK